VEEKIQCFVRVVLVYGCCYDGIDVCVCVCVYCERMSRDLSEGWSNHIELLCYCNNIVMVMKWVQNNELFFHYF
jgi:hypothetical protein